MATGSRCGVRECVPRPPSTMVYLDSFDDFEKAAERVYLNAPMKVRQAECGPNVLLLPVPPRRYSFAVMVCLPCSLRP